MQSKYNLLIILFLTGLSFGCSSRMPEEVKEAYLKLPEQIDFNFHVRPILSDHCFACHGPDEKARKADLRLDTEEAAFAELKEGAGYALVAGKPFKSKAVHRILSAEPDQIMPPPESKMSLTPKQKALLIKWLEQGATWKPHWAFIPPKDPTSQGSLLVI